MTQAYPLQWPQGRPRKTSREDGRFGKMHHNGHYASREKLTIADAIARLQNELDRLGARDYVLSTNLELRLDGLPRSGQSEPEDPGVALYFTLGGEPHCLPCDTYHRAADNIAAIAKHLEATRAIERYGVATIQEMFTGFVALPPPKTWAEILGLNDPGMIIYPRTVHEAYRRLAARYHPDVPETGDANRMAEINAARDDALRALGELGA